MSRSDSGSESAGNSYSSDAHSSDSLASHFHWVDERPSYDSVKERAKRVDQALERIHNQMKGLWVEDQSFFTSTFPTRSLDSNYYQTALSRYNKTRHRWKSIPLRPRDLRAFTTSLQYLLNGILTDHGIDYTNCRVLYTGAADKLKTKEPALVYPALFMVGSGKRFCNTSERAIGDIELGVCPIQLTLDSADSDIFRDRLALQVEHMLQHQPQRRFAFGLIMTPSICQPYYFDRAGSVFCPSFSYHDEPRRFCTLLVGMAGSDASRVGFDPTVFNDGKEIKVIANIKSGKKVSRQVYTMKTVKYHSPKLISKGTSCWLVTGPDGSDYIVRDTWTVLPDVSGKENEKALVDHARSQGVDKGIIQLLHYEEVSCSARTKDTIHRNRHIRTGGCRGKLISRMHIRSISTPQGKPLHEFSTREELLAAFHDAVLAHRQLYCVAGILHRDISPSNILINTGASKGNRGILIDFNQATRSTNFSPYSQCKKMGTHEYMSRNVLSADGTSHTYFDDLESFFWVLSWIVSRYSAPGKFTEVSRSQQVTSQDSDSEEEDGIITKRACFFWDRMELPIEIWFGPIFNQLLGDLHWFFHRRTGYRDVPAAPLDPEVDYTEYLDHIKKAIDELSTT